MIKNKMAYCRRLCVLLLLVGGALSDPQQENIPLLAWSNSKSLQEVPSLGPSLPLSASLGDIVYSGEKIVVFVQKTLTFDDIAKYGGLYGKASSGSLQNVKQFVSKSTSSVVMSLPHQPQLVEFLTSELTFLFVNQDISYFTSEELVSDISKFVDSKCRLCILNLPDKSLSDRSAVLMDNDRHIGAVMESVKQHDYLAFYTAHYSNDDSRKTGPNHLLSKRVVDASNATAYFYYNNNTCGFVTVLSYLDIISDSSDTFRVNTSANSGDFLPTPCDVDANSSVVFNANYTYGNKSDGQASISYLLVPGSQGDMVLPNGFWRLDLEVTLLNTTDKSSNTTLLRYKRAFAVPYPLTVPFGSSFHCSAATFVPVNCTKRQSLCNMYPQVTLNELQVEFYNASKYNRTASTFKFSIDYDCAPYFSEALWMGIFTVSILLPILIVGLFVVFQTQTMDRFDDPREPSLVTTVKD